MGSLPPQYQGGAGNLRTGVFWALLFTASSLAAQSREKPEKIDPSGAPIIDRLWRLPPVEPQTFQLEEIEQLALANNPSLARRAAQLAAARGGWVQSGLYLNPTLGVGQQQTGSGGRAEQDGVSFSQEFVTGGKLRLSRAVAQKEIAWVEQQLAIQQLRVLTDARIGFHQVLIAQEQRRLAKELVNIAARGVRVAEELNRGTLVGKNDVLEAQIELYNAEILARRSTNRHAAAWQSLKAIVGIELPLRELQGDLEQVRDERDWPAVLEKLQGASPEISAALAELERTRAAVDRASVEAVPNLKFDGLVNWRDNGIGGKADGGFLVSLPVPLWNRNQGAVMRARSELTAAERAVRQVELDLANRLATVFERYVNARFQVAAYRDRILPAAAEALKLTRQGYEASEVDYDDLLTSQRTNAQANINYLDALLELRIAESELEGMLLTDSLKAD